MRAKTHVHLEKYCIVLQSSGISVTINLNIFFRCMQPFSSILELLFKFTTEVLRIGAATGGLGSIPLSVQTLENWSHALACRPNQI